VLFNTRIICTLALGLFVLSGSNAVRAERLGKAYPRDDAKTDRGLAEVRAQLRRAIARRDPALLLPVLAPRVTGDHEKSVARDAVLAEMAKWRRSQRNEFWRDLKDAVDLGFAMSKGRRYAYAPYLFVTRDSDEQELAITGAHVNVHQRPGLDSPVIARLSYDIVKPDTDADSGERSVDIGGERYSWVPIITPAGASGWVPAKYARYATGPTFIFEWMGRDWKLISFVIED
jgi:hypothetical protein